MNFIKLFEDCVDKDPDNEALISTSGSLTYGELNVLASKCAYGLTSLGVRPQGTAAILSRNNARCVEVVLGCLKANVIACLVNTRLSPQETANLFSESDVDVILFDEGSLSQARQMHQSLAGGTRFVALDDAALFESDVLLLDDLVCDAPGVFPSVEAADDNIAIQLFTSGSTGVPKAVLHGHRGLTSFMTMFGFAAKHDLVQERVPTREVILGLLPLYHISGFTALYALVSGGTVVLQGPLDIEGLLEAVQDFGITRATIPSTMLEWLLDRQDLQKWNLSSLVELSYGGSPMSRLAAEKAASVLDCSLAQAYGSTESLIATVLSGKCHLQGTCDEDGRASSVGKPMMGVEVKIIDELGRRCPIGLDGEIAVRTPAAMLRYRGKSREESGFDEGQWLRMGDIGHLDEHGFLYVTGRKRELIISGGENIFPCEVENCIAALKDDVASVAVVGAPHPKWGEAPVAFVVRAQGSAITEKQIKEHCEESIAHYKRPDKVVFVDEIPKDALGKVLRSTLKEMIEKGVKDEHHRAR